MSKRHWLIAGYILLVSGVFGQKNLNISLEAAIPQGNILTNDVWGYIDPSGNEYAIVGTRAQAIIYDINDTKTPIEISTIPGPQSVWRDFKSYKSFVYQTTDQGTDGLTIIDMSRAPDTVTSKLWTPEIDFGGISGTLRTCHNIWIDTLAGRAFLSGCNIGEGGALILDIATDPLNPIVVGIENERYSHDIITRDTLLFTSEINQGNLGIYSIADIENPKLISRTSTTSFFTHNAWYSDDGNFIFTTDERGNSFVDAYDISDLSNPVRVDTYQPVEGAGVIPHNVHVKDDFIIASWYGEGVVIIDAHRPHNLVRVGQYDTDPAGQGGSTGCWGAFPFFPSGTIIASDLNNGFFVLKPTYQRASYLEGDVTDLSDGAPINDVQITILASTPISENTNAAGEFATGTVENGQVRVALFHPDYLKDTVTVDLNSSQVTEVNFQLAKKEVRVFAGIVKGINGSLIPEAQLRLIGMENTYDITTDNQGGFNVEVFDSPSYELFISAWGYKGNRVDITELTSRNLISLEEGYEDDFFSDLGWIVENDAISGFWVRDVPIATNFGGLPANPGEDTQTDIGRQCYVTGNGGGNAGFDDIDNGTTTLISPEIPVNVFPSPIIEFSAWFANDGGNTPLNDTLKIMIRSGGKDSLVMALTAEETGGRWRDGLRVKLGETFFDSLNTDVFQVVIEAGDKIPDGHVVEAGIDRFRVLDASTTSTSDLLPETAYTLTVFPNPVSTELFLFSEKDLDIRALKIFDTSGRLWINHQEAAQSIDISSLQSGHYLLQVETPEGIVIKQFNKI